MSLMVAPFFDPGTSSYTYVVVEPCSRTCAIIDPVLDYDPVSRRTSTARADEIVSFVKANDLIVEWVLETHVHADHLSAGRYLKSRFVCAQSGIGAGIRDVRQLINPEAPDPEQCFDRLFEDGDRIALGHARGRVMATPGHTPACISYRFENLVFVGDAVFMPDFGSGRCDFPGGDARELYGSVQRLLSLPDQTRLRDTPLARQCLDFIHCCATRNTPVSDGMLGTDVMHSLDALRESAASGGRWIAIRQRAAVL